MPWLGITGDTCLEGFVIFGRSAGLGREGVMGSVRRSLTSSLNHTHPSHNFSFSKAWPVCIWAGPVGILTGAWDLIYQYDQVMTQHGQCHWKKNVLQFPRGGAHCTMQDHTLKNQGWSGDRRCEGKSWAKNIFITTLMEFSVEISPVGQKAKHRLWGLWLEGS